MIQQHELTELEELRGLYSDMHKEAYGWRPRNWAEVATWTAADFAPVLERLRVAAQAAFEQEEREHAEAAVEVEKVITKLIAQGAGNRATAIRWLHESEETNGDDNYLCFVLGLRYEYFKN